MNPRPALGAVARTCAAVLLIAVGATLISGCRPGRARDKEALPMPARPIAKVLAEHTPALMAMPGVVGTYEGATEDGRPCIGVLLLSDHAETRAAIPPVLEGYPVVIEETGPIRPLDRDST